MALERCASGSARALGYQKCSKPNLQNEVVDELRVTIAQKSDSMVILKLTAGFMMYHRYKKSEVKIL